jgi:uncharacterized protein (DUF952 family)
MYQAELNDNFPQCARAVYYAPMPLFHITTAAAWEEAKASGKYVAPSLATEGFIHLSTAKQWPVTQERLFKGKPNLVLLRIDVNKLQFSVRFEDADGDSFPHLFGHLNVDAVVGVTPLV